MRGEKIYEQGPSIFSRGSRIVTRPEHFHEAFKRPEHFHEAFTRPEHFHEA